MEGPTEGVENAIKIDTAMAVVRVVDGDATDLVWRPYIQKVLLRKGGYDALMKDLHSAAKGEKVMIYSPDGTPAFS